MDHVEEFIFYGDEIRIERFHPDTQFIYANTPMTPVTDEREAVSQALDSPLNADPLEQQLNSSSRVTIAFDDPCLPLPLMRHDIRGVVIEEVLMRLFKLGIKKDRIKLICANGLHRKWTLRELTTVIGKRVPKMIGPERISCHDATKESELIHLGSTESGMDVEINRAVAESDLTIYVNLNFTTMNGGWKSTLVGLGSWRSIRHHHSPIQWNGLHSVMDTRNHAMHGILQEMGGLVKSTYNIFQIETVLNNNVWPGPIERVIRPINNGRRNRKPGLATRALLSLMPVVPAGLKKQIRQALRSAYRLCAVTAGDVDLVHQRTLEHLNRQQNVKGSGQVDILILGVPNLSPYSVLSEFNPILLRSLVLGYLVGMFKNRPLVKKGGIVVAYNPGVNIFHPGHHPSYLDFWENDLDQYQDPEACWNDLSDAYAENPRYIKRYQDHFAYHGTHSLINWTWGGMALRQLKGVILAGAKDPDVARKIGFIPAGNFTSAVAMAREMAGNSPSMAYQLVPPIFCMDMADTG
jgi:hypothetical protein